VSVRGGHGESARMTNLGTSFKLLRRLEGQQEAREAPVAKPATVPPNGSRPRPRHLALIREEEVKLVGRLFLSSPEAPRVVALCGVEPGYSPGWVCARASEALAAQVEGSVCAVDASFRVPGLCQYFGVESPQGLTDVLLNPGAVGNFTQRTAKSNLWLLPCGSQAADPHILLKPGRLQSFLADLRGQFEFILISTPPVNQSADAIALAQASDGVVLVLEANLSRRNAAQRAKFGLEAANVRLLGAVLNNRTFPIPEAIYRKLQ
jgi:Mrp family chromosome partitioning ATPase